MRPKKRKEMTSFRTSSSMAKRAVIAVNPSQMLAKSDGGTPPLRKLLAELENANLREARARQHAADAVAAKALLAESSAAAKLEFEAALDGERRGARQRMKQALNAHEKIAKRHRVESDLLARALREVETDTTRELRSAALLGSTASHWVEQSHEHQFDELSRTHERRFDELSRSTEERLAHASRSAEERLAHLRSDHAEEVERLRDEAESLRAQLIPLESSVAELQAVDEERRREVVVAVEAITSAREELPPTSPLSSNAPRRRRWPRRLYWTRSSYSIIRRPAWSSRRIAISSLRGVWRRRPARDVRRLRRPRGSSQRS